VSKKLQADLIAEVRRIASELGHTPNRDEFRQHSKLGEKAYRAEFGGYTPLVMAAGLKTYADKKDTDAAFVADLTKIEFDSAIKRPVGGTSGRKILALGDLHFPFANLGALSAVLQFAECNPDITDIVQVGDLFDMYSWAKFPRSHLVIRPDEEITLGRRMAEDFWKKLQNILPRAKCWQLLGNHDIRPLKKVAELAPEAEVFIELRKWFEFPGVSTIHDPRAWLEIDGVSFTHGHYLRLGQHAQRYQRNVVCGHTHKGGVFFYQTVKGQILWELNCGYLGDERAKPLSYSPVKQHDWTLGLGVIDQYGPRFISL
jgi:hypothetical protein